MNAPERLQPRIKWALLATLLGAFALRLIYVFESRANPYFESPIMDPLYHLEWARAFARGEDFQPGPFFRAPLYPWFLGAILRFLGDDLLLPRLVQAGLGTLTTWLTFQLGRRTFDVRVGLIAAIAVAINWVLIYFDGELLIPALAIPLNLSALLLTLRLSEKATPRRAVLAGSAWGVAALARPNVLLFMPLVFAWLLWRARPQWRSGFAPGIALALGCALPILPITTYNYVSGDDIVLISSQAGVNLWIGNNPESDGSTAIVPGTRADWWGGYYDSIALAQQAEGRALKPSEVSAHYSARARDFVLQQPWTAAKHFAWKLRLFWLDWELGNNADVHFFATHFSRLMRLLPSSFGLLGPLALIGLWTCRQRGARLFPLWGFTLTYMGSIVLFFVCSRYRAPVLPLFAVLSGAALVAAYENLRAKRRAPLLFGLASFALVAAFTQQLPAGLDKTESKGLWALGLHEAAQGRPHEAVEYLQQAIRANPSFWIAHRDLGLAYFESGQAIEAEASLRRALQLVPNDVQASASLVDVLLARNDVAAAEAVARTSLRFNPHLPQAHDALARVHISRQDWSAARAVLQAGLEAAPLDFFCNFRLGALELQVNRPCEAAEFLRRAINSRAPNAEISSAVRQALEGAERSCAN